MKKYFASLRNMFLFLTIVDLLALVVVYEGDSSLLAIVFIATVTVALLSGLVYDSIGFSTTKGNEKLYSSLMIAVQTFCLYFVVIIAVSYFTEVDAYTEMKSVSRLVNKFLCLALGFALGIKAFAGVQKK
ncbi:MAG: hypothetical protein PHE89_03985 [Alphaproteobacteria bacterium]|nr:hypothetical protein [Alphaproteobacteria bacterium]